MEIENMTRKEFNAVPYRESWDVEVVCDSLVILPLRKHHDSGFRLLDFVATRDGKLLCRLSGCSDVIHFDGIGGYGYRWSSNGHLPKTVLPSGWNIDCLPKSGLLRIFTGHTKIRCGCALSSFEIYVERKNET